MKYPILYKSNETDFFAMGLGPIEMLKATVTQERNGIFIFEGEILTDNPLFPLVLENYLIKADADHLLKDQRFRIKRIVPNHNGKAEIYAEHVSYLSRELTIKPEVNITGSAQVALNQWKASIVESNPFIVSSDITTSASTKWRIDKVSNPMMALGGVEGSILDRWGGEYLFDNYHISLLKKRGKTATNILAYGRNITDFEQERNILSTYTSVAPYAIYTNDSEKEIIVAVDGYVVDSEHVNKFPNRVTKPIDFSSDFGSDEIPTKARLTTLAQQYIADNEIGIPTTSIKISFLDLSQTADYADYAFLEQVNLCDDVRVHYPKLGVNTIAKVVRVVWNCLTESYDEIEIGQKRMSLASQIQEQNKVIQEINTQTNHAQVSADGKNMIFYGLYGENGLGQPIASKIGDTWFKPNGLETEMLIWTGVVWANPFLGGDNIADEAITGTKIANATIGSAKIINVDANKITANTLSAITTNTGALNVSGDLTMTTDNTLIKGTYNHVEDYEGTYRPRTFEGTSQFGRRYLRFAGDTWNRSSTNPKASYIGYADTYVGQDYFKFRMYDNFTNLKLKNRLDLDSTGLWLSSTWGEDTAHFSYDSMYSPYVEAHKVGTNRIEFNRQDIDFQINPNFDRGAHRLAISSSQWGFYVDNPNEFMADFYVGTDGTKPRIWSKSFYERTYSSAANMHVTDFGTVGRSVSARKYKADIETANLSNAKNILQIKPSSWYDKEEIRKGKAMNRYYGFIADEFHELGLTEVVQYGVDGQVEGLAYDRISMYHNVILQDHEKEISALKITVNFDIWQLKNEIKELKNEINSLRQTLA